MPADADVPVKEKILEENNNVKKTEEQKGLHPG